MSCIQGQDTKGVYESEGSTCFPAHTNSIAKGIVVGFNYFQLPVNASHEPSSGLSKELTLALRKVHPRARTFADPFCVM